MNHLTAFASSVARIDTGVQNLRQKQIRSLRRLDNFTLIIELVLIGQFKQITLQVICLRGWRQFETEELHSRQLHFKIFSTTVAVETRLIQGYQALKLNSLICREWPYLPFWVSLNRLRTGVGLFRSTMQKWGLVSSANCRCGAEEQTANHILASYPLYHPPNGTLGLAALDDDTVDWLKRSTLNIWWQDRPKFWVV